MCRRLGRKKLQEKGMLDANNRGPDITIRRVPRMVGKRLQVVIPRPDFTITLHEKMIRVPHRPLFFNYMTRVLWEHTYLRDRIWCTDNEGWNARPRPAMAKHYAKLERYYNRAFNGRRINDYSCRARQIRRAKLARQGVSLVNQPLPPNADFDGDYLNIHSGDELLLRKGVGSDHGGDTRSIAETEPTMNLAAAAAMGGKWTIS